MTMIENHSIKMENTQGGETTGQLNCFVYTPRDRVQRAGKILGLMWLGAVITVFIPIAHFFLVPGFFIGGIVMATLRYKVVESADKVTGTCPTCKESVIISLDESDKLPVWKYCPSCNNAVQLMSPES